MRIDWKYVLSVVGISALVFLFIYLGLTSFLFGEIIKFVALVSALSFLGCVIVFLIRDIRS